MDLSIFDTGRRTGPFSILTVCTGNICRSPLAEGLLRMVLGGLDVTVQSAGTAALVGEPMTEQNQRIAADLGVPDAGQHRARQLTIDQVRAADLVLALTRDHRRQVVELLPKATRYTFTLREFGRLTRAVTPEDLRDAQGAASSRMRDAVEFAAQLRGSLVPLDDPADDDVVDPYRLGDEVYRRSADQLVPALNQTALLLRSSAEQG
jgi:protein-tyrosine phosphatase